MSILVEVAGWCDDDALDLLARTSLAVIPAGQEDSP